MVMVEHSVKSSHYKLGVGRGLPAGKVVFRTDFSKDRNLTTG